MNKYTVVTFPFYVTVQELSSLPQNEWNSLDKNKLPAGKFYLSGSCSDYIQTLFSYSYTAEYISQSLCQIFNSSLTSGVFPDIWKVARVAPIFKAGTRDDLNNYRPISVLCTISKVFEKIVHDQVVNYLVEQKILVQNQYAYRKLHSTITSLIKCTDDWLSNIDSKKVNLTLLLDLKKAFDTVDHKIILDKLGAYGVIGIEFKWFKSYLSKRRQFCRVNDYNSKTMRVTCGIFQGSCLCLPLFILYLNDFENCLQYSSASMYADDKHTTISARDIEELIRKT